MTPQRPNPASDRDSRRYAVGALVVTLLGVVALTLGFTVYPPVIPLGMGLGGAAAGVGAMHLRRALTATDERASADEPRPDAGRGRDPVEILKERYARGEVTDEEFERRLGRLVEHGDGTAGRGGEAPVRER